MTWAVYGGPEWLPGTSSRRASKSELGPPLRYAPLAGLIIVIPGGQLAAGAAHCWVLVWPVAPQVVAATIPLTSFLRGFRAAKNGKADIVIVYRLGCWLFYVLPFPKAELQASSHGLSVI